MDAEDAALIRRVGRGDSAAFEELHRRYVGFVRSVVQRTSAQGSDLEDTCQNALLAIWKQAWRFDPDRSKPTTWIALVTRSVARDGYRSRVRTTKRLERLEGVDAAAAKSANTLERDEMLQEAARTLSRLPRRERSVVLLAWARGLKRREIAHLESVPVGTIKSMIRRTAQRVRGPQSRPAA